MSKKMEKKTIKKLGLYTGLLLCSVSGIALMHQTAQENAPKFNQTKVVVEGDTLSFQDFYSNLSFGAKGWAYTNAKGEKLDFDSLCNFLHGEKAKQEELKKLILKKRIDTIYVSYKNKRLQPLNETNIVYRNEYADSLTDMPAMGKYVYDEIVIRNFKADNPELQKIMDVYNDSLNCTSVHEEQHFLNTQNGLRTWNSYPLKYVECCFDEISANIRQCLQQRKNYINRGKNLDCITDRFNLYKEAIKAGKFNPKNEKISEAEAEFIANAVFDSWMKEKYDLYAKQLYSRSKYYLNAAPYPAILENKEKHNAVMKKIFTIENYDFWKHLQKREPEILAKITPDMKKKWECLRTKKFKSMDYPQQLACQKIAKGEEQFQKDVQKNVMKARMIALFGMDK